MSDPVSYAGLTDAEALWALYHCARAFGLGVVQDDRPEFTVTEAEALIAGLPEIQYPNGQPKQVWFNYVHERPIKVAFDKQARKIYDVDRYDVNTTKGAGTCARAIASALGMKAAGGSAAMNCRACCGERTLQGDIFLQLTKPGNKTEPAPV